MAAERVTPASASSGVRRKSVAAMFSISSSDVAGELPGLQSLAIAMGTPGLAHRLDGRQLLLAQEIEGAGQDHRHGPGARHGRDARPRR